MTKLNFREIDDYFEPTKTRSVLDDFGDETSGIQGIVLGARMVGVSWDAIRARTGEDLYSAVAKTALPKTSELGRDQLRDQLVVSTLMFKSMLTIRMVASAILEIEAMLARYGATESDIRSTTAYLRTEDMRRRELTGVRSVRPDGLRYAAEVRKAEESRRATKRLESTVPAIRRECISALAMLGADSSVIAEAVGISRRSGSRACAQWASLKPASVDAWPVDHELIQGWDVYRRELLDIAYARVRNDLPWAERLIASAKSSYREISARGPR
ncbi:hypothetical protein PT015_13450 [Candidatus Mycobacterium wuenschmannii]|uniref:Uncharacterized protein n=1 Tax=Candidatus Mycobacterium wuenschmannii TaxID=3027808 RepID=A0ABY8VUV8_9MYCO|nr:hypothetical protein [Candidatus Mycobacterium wuenschmannii]WIM85942.1 hypothetical protein PT015_13450 [Candidatus Mycobacterium wuenschmannii]